MSQVFKSTPMSRSEGRTEGRTDWRTATPYGKAHKHRHLLQAGVGQELVLLSGERYCDCNRAQLVFIALRITSENVYKWRVREPAYSCWLHFVNIIFAKLTSKNASDSSKFWRHIRMVFTLLICTFLQTCYVEKVTENGVRYGTWFCKWCFRGIGDISVSKISPKGIQSPRF